MWVLLNNNRKKNPKPQQQQSAEPDIRYDYDEDDRRKRVLMGVKGGGKYAKSLKRRWVLSIREIFFPHPPSNVAHLCLVAETQEFRSIFCVTSRSFIVIHRVKLLRHLCEFCSRFFSGSPFSSKQNVQKFFSFRFNFCFFGGRSFTLWVFVLLGVHLCAMFEISNKNANFFDIERGEKKNYSCFLEFMEETNVCTV